MGCCLTSSSDPCGVTTWVFWLGHWWSELPEAYKVSPTGWRCRTDAKEKVPEILTEIHRLLFQIPQCTLALATPTPYRLRACWCLCKGLRQFPAPLQSGSRRAWSIVVLLPGRWLEDLWEGSAGETQIPPAGSCVLVYQQHATQHR